MKVAIVAPTPVPFARGGAERAWAGLQAGLTAAGHDVETVKVPVREGTLGELVAGYRAFSQLDLTHFDAVISSKYPAWMCSHPHHVLWMFHPLRGLYDTYHHFGLPLDPGPLAPEVAELAALVQGPPERRDLEEVFGRMEDAVAAVGPTHPQLALPGPVSRMVVHWLDRLALEPPSIRRYVTLSATVAGRADYLPPGIQPRVAYAPSDLVPADGSTPPPPAGRVAGSYFFTASRLDGPKRLDLLIRAMAHVPGDVRLLIGGTGPEADRLRLLAGDDDRIELLGFVPDEDLPGYYAGALAVPFLPLDEDYGLITVEAMAVGTPVVTCTDSGGPTELVLSGVDGLVVAPDPAALGTALAELAADPARAEAMGRSGRRRAGRITWPSVVRTLLGPERSSPPTPSPPVTSSPTQPELVREGGAIAAPSGTAAAGGRRAGRSGRRSSGRPRVVALTTYRVAERGHGGQLRVFNLYRGLARHADVEILSLAPDGPATSTEIAPGLVETAIPRSPAHARADDEAALALGVPMSDLVAGSAIAETPAYLRHLRRAARDADVVVLAHPYMLPALDQADVDRPLVYEAHNVETALKADVLPDSPGGDEAMIRVRAVEVAAASRAVAITACSDDDATVLAAMGGKARTAVSVIPNGADCAALIPPDPAERAAAGARWLARAGAIHPDMARARALAVFFASWHPPNLDAAEILLEVAARVPEVAFVLGGRHGDAFAGRRTPGNLAFTGMVSDRAKAVLLGSAQVALNPMTYGSGTNLKVLEALAAGVPVVSSDVGARGLAITAGEHLLVTGADPDEIAEAVRATVADPEAAASRARAGRALVEARYDWGLLGESFAQAVLAVGERRMTGSDER